MITTVITRESGWECVIGPNLRRVEEWGLGPVVSCETLRKAMGLKEGKLPEEAVEPKNIADTVVFVMSRRQAELKYPSSTRPHRMYAVCNYCGRDIPTGRFGQHLKVHDEERAVRASLVP